MRVMSQAIVATAAASGLGRQLTRYASACGIDVVAVVRRAEQMQVCREEGAIVTLDASTDSFDADVKVGARVKARPAAEAGADESERRVALERARTAKRRRRVA